MARGKQLNGDQMRTAADMLARGESKAAVARAVVVSDRAIRRWLADAESPLSRAVAARARSLEHAEHANARVSARRHGLPAPLHPRERREQAEAFEAARAEVMEAPPFRTPERPALNEEAALNLAYQRRLAERGRISVEEYNEMFDGLRPIPSRHRYGATSGFTLRPDGGSVQQGLARSDRVETTGGYVDGAPAWATTDAFAGLYGR